MNSTGLPEWQLCSYGWGYEEDTLGEAHTLEAIKSVSNGSTCSGHSSRGHRTVGDIYEEQVSGRHGRPHLDRPQADLLAGFVHHQICMHTLSTQILATMVSIDDVESRIAQQDK